MDALRPLRVLIVAGGRGVRMGSLTDNQQKCLMTVAGRPVLEHVLNNLQKAFGSAEVVIATGYYNHLIKQCFGNRFGKIPIRYVHDPNLIGVKRRILLAEKICEEPLLVLPGDVIVSPHSLRELVSEYYRNPGHLATLLLTKEHAQAPTHGLKEVAGSEIVRSVYPGIKEWEEGQLRATGIFYVGKGFFEFLQSTPPEMEALSGSINFGLEKGFKFNFHRMTDCWYHFAVPQDLEVESIVF